ncbi:glycosyltransferase [Halobacteria archaeon AArc-m2/3/4]|uniref:Glycosyltransferase n=1 Tax=Natronoglomus mannanivorans TaxID=2979990 RepID=A0ABT2QKB4_9EURY|nr:glycosyltransferase [Halobacteria archaeon AArc-m2/3/4]
MIGTYVLYAILAASFLLIIHVNMLYPFSLKALSLFNQTEDEPHRDQLPTVTLIIAAYNEEDIIEKKLKNSLGLEYPPEKYEIVVFSDASTDRTDEIVSSYSGLGVDLCRIEGRVGKTECQNRVVDMVDTDIVVFSDANSMYDKKAIKEIVSSFQSNVGCVVGELRYTNPNDMEGESVYWKYEQWLKNLESATGSLVAGNGSIYAVKKESYVPLDEEVTSDLAEVLEIVRNGEYVKYNSSAFAFEELEETINEEINRKKRIATRSFNTIVKYTDLISPFNNITFSYKFLSRTILRWLLPIWLILFFASNLILSISRGGLVLYTLLTLQIIFYCTALFSHGLNKAGRNVGPVLTFPYYFSLINYALLVGAWNLINKQNVVTWETVDR